MSFSRKIFLENFLQMIIKASVVEFILNKTQWFQHILLDTIRRIRLKYEMYSLRRVLFYTFKQYSDYKSLIAKTFTENTLKMKDASPI